LIAAKTCEKYNIFRLGQFQLVYIRQTTAHKATHIKTCTNDMHTYIYVHTYKAHRQKVVDGLLALKRTHTLALTRTQPQTRVYTYTQVFNIAFGLLVN